MKDDEQSNLSLQGRLLALVFDLPWLELISHLWKIARKIIRGLADEGVYKVLDYECRLELKDEGGHLATIKKREKVQYLQNHVNTYQDQAWGDSEILVDYRCSPGVPVDEYRLGHKTYKIISLREDRNKGDTDEFNIEWKMRNGFLLKTGFWGTSINHRTKKARVTVIFPKTRPPLKASITESNLKRTKSLSGDALQKLPDGRSMVVWENTNPRLYENYVLSWEW